jgi:hypothetical protein
MARSVRVKRVIVGLAASGLAVHLASCGTILHPERRGQPPGRLDPGIVILDAVGLLLFFVPGVVAFAVDFATGAIYLPPEYVEADLPGYAPCLDASGRRVVRLSPEEITPERLEKIVQEHTGHSIRLQPGTYRVLPIENVDKLCDETLDRLRTENRETQVVFPGAKRE